MFLTGKILTVKLLQKKKEENMGFLLIHSFSVVFFPKTQCGHRVKKKK